MIIGARQGRMSGLRRLVGAAMAQDLSAFLIPGPDIAGAHNLDIEAAGLRLVASPRHASVLLVIGAIPPALRESAAVIYAQMMRPRALFVLGTEELSPLPSADITADLSQEDLVEGVRRLRTEFAEGAFKAEVSDFDALVLQTRIRYSCPMHPEVMQDEPGTCHKCGMELVQGEAQAEAEAEGGHKHGDDKKKHAAQVMPTTSSHEHSRHKDMDHSAMDHGDMDHSAMDHGAMDHSAMDHGDMAFMSMIDVTKDLPSSADGLPMEWIEVPFGPFFPGLPGGLLLTLTLDGDTVAGSDVRSLTGIADLLQRPTMGIAGFVEQMSGMDPLAPIAYRLLACRAVENAAGVEVTADSAHARVGALERERIASHLGWLALFGRQSGFLWLTKHAASLQLNIRHGEFDEVMALRPALQSLSRKLLRAPLLRSRTVGIGRLEPAAGLRGPVARASGISADARDKDKIFHNLGFTPARREEGDAFARLRIRLDEISHSLTLIEAAGFIELPKLVNIGDLSGKGEAEVETARGMARLELTLEDGQIVAAELETPSTTHLGLVEVLTAQQALGDALTAVGSLDISPWEVRQ